MNIKKVGKVLLIGLIVILLFISYNNFRYEKKLFPNGMIMIMDRLNKNILVKPIDCYYFYVIDDLGNVSYRNNKTREEIRYVEALPFNRYYQMHLSVFKDY